MKIDGSLGSLLQGVSQQAPRDRFDGQCTLQENMSSDAVRGLTRRPPTDLVGFLDTASSILGWHNFQTRDGKKFLAMFKAGDVKVFDLNATAQAVTVDTNALPYLATTNSMKFNTDGLDNTVVVNPSVKVAMQSSVPTYYNTEGTTAAIFQVLGGAFAKTYGIYINGSLVSAYRPPTGAAAGDATYTDTGHICKRLIEGLQTVITVTAPDTANSFHFGTGFCSAPGWSIGFSGDVFYIKPPSGAFTVSVADGNGGVNFKVCTDTVTDVADLPRIAPHYYAIRVAENTDPDKDLWFKFIANANAGSTIPDPNVFGMAGYWQEAVAPGTNTSFNPSTMPHKLTYTAPNFQFSRETYNPRPVGTGVSNPDPSFIGNVINDVATFQGRTVFLSGSNVVMSRTNRPTNFWRGSASALADTDPIDVNSTVESSQMLAAVQYNKDLAVFSRKAQFVVFGRSALTPMNAALVLTTRFESEANAHPVGAGRNVFFASTFGRYTGIREFYSENTSDANDSRPVTQHVNRYLEGKARRLTASSNYETLLVHTDSNQTDLYLYQYIWSDDKKLQSAWSTWKFENSIVHSFFDEDTVYLVQKLGTNYYLLRMPLDVQDNDGVGYPVMLDQRFDVQNCHKSFVLPYPYLANSRLVVVQGAGCPTPGLSVRIKSIVGIEGTGWVVTLQNDMEGGHIVVGTRFTSRYIPTMPSVKDANGVKIGTSKVRAKAFLISLNETGDIIGQVRSKYGDGEPVPFNARIVGDVDNVVGEQPLSDGEFTMPFRYNVDDAEIELYTDSHLPMGLSDIEYVGQYSKRGRRIANQGGKQ